MSPLLQKFFGVTCGGCFIAVPLFLLGVSCVEIKSRSSGAEVSINKVGNTLVKKEADPESKATSTAQPSGSAKLDSLLHLEVSVLLSELDSRVDEMEENFNSRQLARVCVSAGRVAALLKALGMLGFDKTLTKAEVSADPVKTQLTEVGAEAKFADPSQWISVAGDFAPICERVGSSQEHFVEDLKELKQNIKVVKGFFK